MRTRAPSEAKSRHCRAASSQDEVWRGLRATTLLSLDRKQTVALASEPYRPWASERTFAIIHAPEDRRPDQLQADEDEAR